MPTIAIGAFVVLNLTGALFIHRPTVVNSILSGSADALVVHQLIFCFICDDIQQKTLRSFVFSLIALDVEPLLFDFFSNPQRSLHHAVDDRMQNSITECCFSYILNRPGRLTHFPGIHYWASKSKRRPWLWRWRKPKGAITNTLSEFKWRQKEHIGCHKKLRPFWALVLALKYLPYLLNKATRSGELIALAKMWSSRYPLPVSLFPHDTKNAGKAVEHYLFRFDHDGRE